jgi:hypothetical protein
MKTTVAPLSKEEFTTKIRQGYDRRQFILDDLKKASSSLSDMEAFALSRLVPKDILERLLADRMSGALCDKIVDYHLKIKATGLIDEVKCTKEAEETFLSRAETFVAKLME